MRTKLVALSVAALALTGCGSDAEANGSDTETVNMDEFEEELEAITEWSEQCRDKAESIIDLNVCEDMFMEDSKQLAEKYDLIDPEDLEY